MSTLVEELCSVVEKAIRDASQKDELSSPITESSAMNNPREWDSMAFVSIFMAVSEHFDLDVEEDDAIHFMSISAMAEFLEDIKS